MRSGLIGGFRKLVAKLAPSPNAATRDAPDDRVIIEYSPHLDGDADPGEVVWTWVPYEKTQAGRDRRC